MLIITGANGKLGGAVADRLLERIEPERIGVSVRDAEAANGLSDRGVRVRRGDFNDAASLDHAFEGASRVFVVSASETGKDAVAQHRAAIEAAKAAGAERVLYTSHMGSSADSAFAPMPDHAATEEILAESGIAFTSLRNGFYASSMLMMLGDAVESGELVAPEDGPVSWTAHADLAEAAAIALSDGSLDGLTPPLTAAEAVDLEGIAAILSDLTDRSISRVVVSDDDYREAMVARGIGEARAEMLVGLFVASRAGDFAETDPTLTRLIGHSPMSAREVLAAATAPTVHAANGS